MSIRNLLVDKASYLDIKCDTLECNSFVATDIEADKITIKSTDGIVADVGIPLNIEAAINQDISLVTTGASVINLDGDIKLKNNFSTIATDKTFAGYSYGTYTSDITGTAITTVVGAVVTYFRFGNMVFIKTPFFTAARSGGAASKLTFTTAMPAEIQPTATNASGVTTADEDGTDFYSRINVDLGPYTLTVYKENNANWSLGAGNIVIQDCTLVYTISA